MRTLCLVLAALVVPALSAQLDLAAEHGLTEPGVYAVFETSLGSFAAELYRDRAPITVENFIGLATGEKPWRAIDRSHVGGDQREHTGEPFYDGTIFHRIIAGFMIQGGAPRGVENPGASGPGFSIRDEFVEGLHFDAEGRLAMANAGPNSAGSQFFVTVAPLPRLDFTTPQNRARGVGYTIFGQVVQGMDVVHRLSEVPTTGPPADQPLDMPTLDRVVVVEVPEASAASPEATAASPEAPAAQP